MLKFLSLNVILLGSYDTPARVSPSVYVSSDAKTPRLSNPIPNIGLLRGCEESEADSKVLPVNPRSGPTPPPLKGKLASCKNMQYPNSSPTVCALNS